MLKDLIEWLEAQDPSLKVRQGFGYPHSYRGDYSEVAFVPEKDTTFGCMLENARSALGGTYSGWKGGDYTMGEDTHCWIAEWGSSEGADRIGNTMYRLWEESAYA